MGWKDYPKWLKWGITLVIINILMSLVAYSISDIRNPQGYSDLKALYFPNVLLGFPTIILLDITNLENLFDYEVNLPLSLFIYLSIYWFIIGAIIGLIYERIKSKKA